MRWACGTVSEVHVYVGGVIFGTDPFDPPTIFDRPEFQTLGECIDCGWRGDPSELLSNEWEDYRYCPKCGSDETEINDYEWEDQS